MTTAPLHQLAKTIRSKNAGSHLYTFDNVVVRRAVNHAVDKRAIIDSVLNSLATPIAGPLFPEARGFDPGVTGYPFDRDRARALVREAGVEPGTLITLDATSPFKEVSEAIANQLKQVGLNVGVNIMEDGVLTSRINQGESQMYYATWGDSSADAGVTFYRHFSGKQRNTFKDTWYSRPDLDRLIDDGRAETALERRQELFRQALRIIVDDAPWLFLWQPTTLAATRTNVKGFVARPDGYLFLSKVTKS